MAPHALMDETAPMKPAEREAVVADLRELMAVERSLSQAVVARSSGISRSIVSQLLSGTYKGDADLYLRKLARWMADRAERAESPVAAFVETGFARAVFAVCRRSLAIHTIGQVVAPAGLGKTMALREFARRRGVERSLYLLCTEADSSLPGMVWALAEKLGITLTTRSSTPRLYRQVRQRLADFYAGGAGAGFLVIADEAHTLSPRAKHGLRNLHDEPDCGCSVVFADTARLTAGLEARGARAMYEQLTSRMRSVCVIGEDEAVSAEDVRAVSEAVIAAGGHAARLTAEAVKFLTACAQERGKLRNAAVRVQTVADVAAAAGVAPRFNAVELDFVADLVGARRQHPEWPNPFATTVAGIREPVAGNGARRPATDYRLPATASPATGAERRSA